MDKDRPTLPRIGELERRPDPTFTSSIPTSSIQLSTLAQTPNTSRLQIHQQNVQRDSQFDNPSIEFTMSNSPHPIALPPQDSSRPRLPQLTSYPPRSDMSYTTHRLLPYPETRPQSFPMRHQILDTKRIPSSTAIPQLVSKHETDPLQHSHHSSSTSAAALTTAAPSISRQTPISVIDGAVSKPKKLHREVEQNRRQRMTEQIDELRKWVSDPNGGKTDKVSVLQDAVTYVKNATGKINRLTKELERSRAECIHLRSIIARTQPHLLPPQQSTNPSPLTHGGTHTFSPSIPSQPQSDTMHDTRMEITAGRYPHHGFSVSTAPHISNTLPQSQQTALTPSNRMIAGPSGIQNPSQLLPSAQPFYNVASGGMSTQPYHGMVDSTGIPTHYTPMGHNNPSTPRPFTQIAPTPVQTRNIHEPGRNPVAQSSQQHQQQPPTTSSTILHRKNLDQGHGDNRR